MDIQFQLPARPHLIPQAKVDFDFDPKVDLQLEPPKEVLLFPDFEKVSWPLPPGKENARVAASVPFRIFSDEGARKVKEITLTERYRSRKMDPNNPEQAEQRIPETLRGLAYSSTHAFLHLGWTTLLLLHFTSYSRHVNQILMNDRFVHDYCADTSIIDLWSRLAGIPLEPSTIGMTWGHVNYGKTPGMIVDQWHFDSVYAVLVCLVSEPSTKGGDLELLLKPRAEGFETLKKFDNKVPEELLFKVNLPGPGYGVFLIGSEVMHHVNRIEAGPEDRITLVTSFNPSDTRLKDPNNYRTFVKGEPEIAPWEFTVHKSYRVGKQMVELARTLPFTQDVPSLSAHLKQVIAELQHSVDLLEGKAEDEKMFYQEIKKEELEQQQMSGGMMSAPAMM